MVVRYNQDSEKESNGSWAHKKGILMEFHHEVEQILLKSSRGVITAEQSQSQRRADVWSGELHSVGFVLEISAWVTPQAVNQKINAPRGVECP